MKVLVVNNAAPFIRGGAEELADELVRRLNARNGVQAELMRLPFAWEPKERLIDEILLHQTFRPVNVDRIIVLKFPAYLVPHHHKTLWLLHQFRQAYDLADAGQSHLGDDAEGRKIKRAIKIADDACFADARAIFVNSPVTKARLAHYNQRDSQVLYPPLNDARLFVGGPSGDYIFAGGRVGAGKRQHLLVEAMAKLKTGRLIIAGPPQSPEYESLLRGLIQEHGLEDRVELHLDFHPRETIAAWINGALACACLPYDEDSLSYVAMEAFAAGKPVLTVTDSGGVLELVSDQTGFVAKPEPDALAESMARLFDDSGRARALGAAARDRLSKMGLSWETTLDRLLA